MPTDFYDGYNLHGNKQPGTTSPVIIKMYCGALKSVMLMQPLPLVIVNGCEIQSSELKFINRDTIQSINVFKNTSAVEKYGEKAKYGAIEITLKSSSINVITKAEIPTLTPTQ